MAHLFLWYCACCHTIRVEPSGSAHCVPGGTSALSAVALYTSLLLPDLLLKLLQLLLQLCFLLLQLLVLRLLLFLLHCLQVLLRLLLLLQGCNNGLSCYLTLRKRQLGTGLQVASQASVHKAVSRVIAGM
jgi:hypothetical protein